MSKTGQKILQGAREALAVAQGDPDVVSKIKVTPSCGCVFCDLGFKPTSGFHRFETRPKQDYVCSVDMTRILAETDNGPS